MKRKIWHRRVIPALCMAIGIGLLTICLCLWQGAVRANESPTHTFLQEYKVLIDPGHGGSDGGATGIRTQAREAEINLDIACKLRDQLRLQGAQVVMTREDEVAVGKDKNTDMRNRRTMIENAGQFHAVGVNGPTMGTVIWRNLWGDDACFEAHADQCRATLIDCCKGGWM